MNRKFYAPCVLLIVVMCVAVASIVMKYHRDELVSESLLFVGDGTTDRLGFGFLLYNNSGNTLSYDDGFRLFRRNHKRWVSVLSLDGDVAYYIEPGVVKGYGVQWWDAIYGSEQTWDLELAKISKIDPGRYMFVKRFFLEPQNLGEYISLQIEFTVVSDEVFIDNRTLYDNWQQSNSQKFFDFISNVPTSENIVLASGIELSGRGISFSLKNQTSVMHTYNDWFELAYCENDRWKPVQTLNWSSRASLLIPQSIQGGEIVQHCIGWDYFFGELPPGRYMFVKEYESCEAKSRLEGITTECVIIEFILEA